MVPRQFPRMTTYAMLEEHRTALTGHCYRMLGSVFDADDAVQDTMFRAWKAIDRFDQRSSLRTWLYRIATNVCLDTLKDRPRRGRPMEEGPVGTTEDILTEKPRDHWLEPIPDAMAIPSDADPSEEAILRESIRLAFVSALQHLPPKQRAVLILTQVLGWSAAEVAESLDTTVASVNSALQRARETLAKRNAELGRGRPALSQEQANLVARYVDAFERYDMDALTKLLHEDATLSMPPYSLWLQGHDAIAAWMLGRGAACRGSRLVPVAASDSPAFGHYKDGGRTPWGLVVLEMRDGHISGINTFLDVATLFPKFGLPMRLGS
jgi:RNA polymerase sigma-70 factor (ECF subfamily)